MRRARLVLSTLLVLGAGLATTASAAGDDGTLAVTGATGLVQIKATGAVVGRITGSGKVRITDPDPTDGSTLQIQQCPDKTNVSATTADPDDKTIVCSGTDIRFRLVGGAFRLTVSGVGINLSVVGRGHFLLAGTVKMAGAGETYTVGTYSVNDSDPRAMPEYLPSDLNASAGA
jgi:hypothetical protein